MESGRGAETSRSTSIVTDENWQPKEYHWQMMWMRLDGAEEEARVLLIEALPVLDDSGTPVTQTDGTPLYELRNLHLSAALLKRLKDDGYAFVIFRLGQAVLLIPLETLESADYIFTLEPVLSGEMTVTEEEAFAPLETLATLCRASVRVDGKLIELSKIRLLPGTLWEDCEVSLEDTELFALFEDTRETMLIPTQTATVAEEAEKGAPLWSLCVALTPQTQAKDLTFAPVHSLPAGE